MTFKMEIVLKKDEKTEIQNQHQMFISVFPCYSSLKFPLYHTVLSLINYPYFSGLKKKKNWGSEMLREQGQLTQQNPNLN